jgi:tRNA(fMet)-specific endonuclease VapC
MLVLDTSTLIDFLRGHRGVMARFSEASPQDLAISVMTVSELRYGAIASRDPARGMRESAELINEIKALPFTVSAALLHAELRLALRHKPIGDPDMIIAATALASSATVVTSNLGVFSRVPNLQVESWR